MKKFNIKGDIIPNDLAEFYKWFGADYTCPADVTEVLNTLEDGEEITIAINSGGGDVVSGQEIYSMLRKISGSHKVIVEVESMAASAASMIAMAGSVVRMSPVALLMIHNASCTASGDYRVFMHNAAVLETVNAAIRAAYIEKTGMTDEQLIEMMDYETWLTANQCVEKGFADEIIRDHAPAIVTNAMIGQLSITPEMIETAKAEMEKEKQLKAEKEALLADLDLFGI